MQEKIIILDFGSQTTQLIGRRVRELNMYCEIVPYNKFPYDDPSVIGVILSGSPFSVYDEKAFKVDLSGIRGKYPLLGICYGAQFMAYVNGGTVESADSREYGRARLEKVDSADPLLAGIEPGAQVWMSHGDTITSLPAGFKIIASTDHVPVAAYRVEGEKVWGVQFHPEVYHTRVRTRSFCKNFVADICGARSRTGAPLRSSNLPVAKPQASSSATTRSFSDSAAASTPRWQPCCLNKAIGKYLTCIFVDHGMLRKNEFADVMRDYEGLGLNVIGVDASEKFFKTFRRSDQSGGKRKIIGSGFIDVFDAEARTRSRMRSGWHRHHLP